MTQANKLVDPLLFELVLKNRQMAYAISDHTLTVAQVGGATSLFHPLEGSIIGRSLYEVAPELIGSEAELQTILGGESPFYSVALVNRETPAATLGYVSLTNLPHRDDAGHCIGIVHLVEDVTQQGVLEQRLTQQRNELALLRDRLAEQNLALTAANVELHNMHALKSRFVGVAAHELRNPLTSILGYVELLEEDEAQFEAEHVQFIDTIKRSAQRVLSITNDLLDVTRIEAGNVELILRPTNLATLVEEAADELQLQVNAKQQRLFLDASDRLPLALCDPARTQQIVTNLLSNAIKYTPAAGEISIRLDANVHAGFIVLSIADTGIGIAQAEQASLFHSFFRASNSHLTRATGVGLGLNITRSLVELQGGRIWFSSELNQGSTFYVTIPIEEQPES
ncbi:MAG: PAS domain-containing sensor histidine kinase [Chloroflexota bacterium]|nr:PAS domain-containing sensor histidine kinase [Chloroflexota bacterium]